MTLWIVGQYRSGEIPNVVWEFEGVFDDEDLAVAACKTDRHFVAPWGEMNKVLTTEESERTYEFPGAYHPKAIECR